MSKKKIIIVGAGPAALIAADVLSETHEVLIFDKEKTIGRKFLVAGKGGFNLTNQATGYELISKYLPQGFLDEALTTFDTQRVRDWLAIMDIPTFVGTSGRIFPEVGIKPSEVLTKIKNRLITKGVEFRLKHEFIGFDAQRQISFRFQDRELKFKANTVIFALGGASWPKTGSTGAWTTIFEQIGVKTRPFQASNCGICIQWPDEFKEHHAGKPLKNIRFYTDALEIKGEGLVTSYGLEGNAIYPMIPDLRKQLNLKNEASIFLDLKPLNSIEDLLLKISKKTCKPKDYASLFNLNAMQLSLLKCFTNKEQYLSPTLFVQQIKGLKLKVDTLRPIEEAISTIGGIGAEELNPDFSLKAYPWIYTVGEMVDWDAPTGGYLLQGCFSTGYAAAQAILQKESDQNSQ